MRRMRMRNAGVTIAIGIALLMLLFFAIPSTLAADTVTVVTPNGGYFGGTETITWSSTTDNGTSDNFTIFYNTTDAEEWILIVDALANDSTTYSWDTSANTSLADGSTYNINVTKSNDTDFTQNVSGMSSNTFTIDNTAPSVVVGSTGVGLGTDDVAHTQQTTLDFTGRMTDATAGNKNISVLSTAGVLTGNAWIVSGATLTAGCNVVTATGYDNSNNSGTDTLTVCHSPAGLAIVRLPTPTPTPVEGLLPLSIIPEEGVPDEAKKVVVVAAIALVLFLVYRSGSGNKSKRKRRR